MILRVCSMLLLATSLVWASPLIQAEQSYKDQNYKQALQEYWSLYGDYPDSVELNYNLGTVYFKLNDIGKSVFYYKKALRLSPRDKETQENLDFVRQSVVGISNESSIKPLFSFLSKITGKQLLILSIMLVLILNGCTCYYFFIKPSELLKNSAIACFIVMFFSLICLVAKEAPGFEVKEGVVIVKKTAIMSGPSDSFKDLFFVHEGYEFEEIFSQGDWSKIKLANGAIGWIKRSDYWSI